MLAVLVVLSCLPGILSHPTRAADDLDITVENFRLSLISGAELDEQDRYVFRTYNSNSEHRFRLRLTYATSGYGNIPAGGVDITLPYSIFRDRDDKRADRFEISLSKEGDANNQQDFAYRVVDGDVVHITNTHPISAAQNGYVEIAYVTNRDAFSFEDMKPSLPCQATLHLTRDGNSIQRQSNSYQFYIDTFAKARYSQTISPDSFYQEWQDRWGEKPADGDAYYYLIWTVGTYINASQPYRFHLEDLHFPSSPDCSVVGCQYQEEKKKDPDHDNFRPERDSYPILKQEATASIMC